MKLHYHVCQIATPNPKLGPGGKSYHYYPRVHQRSEVNTRHIASMISDRSSLTESDVYACIKAFVTVIPQYLRQGDVVRLDGLGRFSLKLESKPAIPVSGVPNKDHVRIAKVSFYPAQEFQRSCREVELCWSPSKKQESDEVHNYPQETLDLLAQRPNLSIGELAQLLSCSYATARRCLEQLRMQALLTRSRRGKLVYYALK